MKNVLNAIIRWLDKVADDAHDKTELTIEQIVKFESMRRQDC